MIELNLTYEESKKILELGYDFSSICRKFEYVTKLKDGHAVMYKVGNNLSDGIKIYKPTYGLVMLEGFTPLIPKAALEACLPDINPNDDERLPDIDTHKLKVFKCHTDMCDREHEEVIKQFNSAFEAFLWVHENYPEELKKKFDEVMA
jgi:hypothetical protein